MTSMASGTRLEVFHGAGAVVDLTHTSMIWWVQVVVLLLAIPADGPLHSWPAVAIAAPVIGLMTIGIVVALVTCISLCVRLEPKPLLIVRQNSLGSV